MDKILVITPTYNEIANIPSFIDSILNLPNDINMLVVDDASPDGTGKYVSSHNKINEKLFLISRERKMGLGSAYCDAFNWALKHDYNKIIQIDADFSHNPKYIKDVLEASKYYDLIIGTQSDNVHVYINNGANISDGELPFTEPADISYSFPYLGEYTRIAVDFLREPNTLNIIAGISTGGLYHLSGWYCTKGDLNEDGNLNVMDIVLMVNFVLDNNYNFYADMNEDSIINILDIVELLNIILSD